MAMTVIDYEDTLHLPGGEELVFVDSVDRDGFAAYFIECFERYEQREGGRRDETGTDFAGHERDGGRTRGFCLACDAWKMCG